MNSKPPPPSISFDATSPLPQGYRCAGFAGGIKSDGQLDMALFVSDHPATCAGTFTRNKLCAAPVKIGRERVPGADIRAIVMNSGNANACTDPQGDIDARTMGAETASVLGVNPAQVLMCSTGGIGKFLPMPTITAALPGLVAALAPNEGEAAAQAMMTTDTRPKRFTTVVTLGGVTCRFTGFAKGAGMIEPNMATMLAYLFTDARVAPTNLQALLSESVNASFNRISIDGDQSTNDTVYLMANGGADGPEISPDHPDWPLLVAAIQGLCTELALAIVKDGEGMTRFITLVVEGARDDAEADQAARAIANSFLVKTGWAGVYPAWSRILDVLGYCDVELALDAIAIDYDDLPVVRNTLATDTPADAVLKVSTSDEYTVRVDLGVADGKAVLYTCDCTEEYVRINLV